VIVRHVQYQMHLGHISAGLDGAVVVFDHRPAKSPRAHYERRKCPARKPKPIGTPSCPSLYWWLDIDLGDEQEEKCHDGVPTKPKRSLHPGKLTRAERAKWVKLPKGWDADHPRRRSDCVGNRKCPWCFETVAMRISGTCISCPECKAIVGYAQVDELEWMWVRLSLGRHHRGIIYDADLLPMRARNHCRPCVWARCSLHLYLEVKDCGSIKLNHHRLPPERMDELDDTCAQDVADREDDPVRVGKDKLLPLEIVGAKLGLTLERARQIEAHALQNVHIQNMRDNRGCV
jgi:hypothetical protein